MNADMGDFCPIIRKPRSSNFGVFAFHIEMIFTLCLRN